MVPSFHNADRPTHRRVMVVGVLFCLTFVVVSFSLRSQPDGGMCWSRPTGWYAPPASRTGRTSAGRTAAQRSVFVSGFSEGL